MKLNCKINTAGLCSGGIVIFLKDGILFILLLKNKMTKIIKNILTK